MAARTSVPGRRDSTRSTRSSVVRLFSTSRTLNTRPGPAHTRRRPRRRPRWPLRSGQRFRRRPARRGVPRVDAGRRWRRGGGAGLGPVRARPGRSISPVSGRRLLVTGVRPPPRRRRRSDTGARRRRCSPRSAHRLHAERPPMRSHRCWDSASPTPVPSIPDCSSPRRSKGTKTRSKSSGRIPGPVSATASRSRPDDAVARTCTSTRPPGWLYFTALDNRLSRTCMRRWRSAATT